MLHFSVWHLVCGAAAALLVGISKTGMPGAGILIMPLLAIIFTGRMAVGTMLPMLILGDIFAVTWYRKHTQWDKLWGMLPYVFVGMAGGAWLLEALAKQPGTKDQLNQIIGVIVLIMLGIHVLRMRIGEGLAPRSKLGIFAVGSAAGFTTTASNAAGPVMTMYLQGMGMKKEAFMGTNAWFFFIVNVAKIPIFMVLSRLHPDKPMITTHTAMFDLLMAPVVIFGVYAGKWLYHRIPQRAFDDTMLVLAAVASVYLAFGPQIEALWYHH